MIKVDEIRTKLEYFLDNPKAASSSALEGFLKEIEDLGKDKDKKEQERIREIHDKVEYMLKDALSRSEKFQEFESKYQMKK